jgi:hypothetical protein
MEAIGQLHAAAALPSRKDLLVSTEQEYDVPQGSFVRGGEQKNFCSYLELNPSLQPLASHFHH